MCTTLYFELARNPGAGHCTCEVVLLDVRTGTIPFTTVTTRDRLEKKEKQDLNVTETMRRAETGAVLDSLNAASDKLVAFLAKAPDQ